MKVREMQTSDVVTTDQNSSGDQNSLVDEMVAAYRTESATPRIQASIVGQCIDACHPTLTGRVRVEWNNSDGLKMDTWLPCLQGLVVRKDDRVLVQQPDNWPEPLVVGVVDGFAMRREVPYTSASDLILQTDEVVRIVTPEGQPLLEICQKDGGPILRLLTDDLNLDVKGRFTVSARSVTLNANRGEMKITAKDDVIVEGETIKLN